MPFKIIRNDIARVKADAIVNTANPHPVIGNGTDAAIYRAAGEDALLAARKEIGELEPGQAVQTPAFGLDAQYIIHVVGPMWIDGTHGEGDILRACYKNALSLALSLSCESIAFPLLASGVYGFPKKEALDIALSEIGSFLLVHDMDVMLVVFDRTSVVLSTALMGDIDEFINEHAVATLQSQEYCPAVIEEVNRRRQELAAAESTADGALTGKSLDEVLDGCSGEGFRERLFSLIDEKGFKDVAVYKRANIDRKVFSRIRCKADYRPSKNTALALAIALRLNLEETRDLLARAGYALSPTNRFDLIVAYFITHKKYSLMDVNTVLFAYGEPLIE